MRIHAAILLLAVSTLCAQEPASSPQAPAVTGQVAAPAAQIGTITIPTGTRIPLALSSPISSKSRPGDPVRAVTGFPVTVGKQLAVPVGTYVVGMLDKVTKGGRSGPSLKMHFTRLDYVNGYSVDIDGANVQASAASPRQGSTQAAGLAGPSGSYNSFAATTFPQPTLPAPASHIGAAIGIGIAATAAGIAIPLILIHRGGGGSGGVLFDSGWQFEMVLESPVTVDSANVAEAAAHSH
jgi:hypothetical protein